jgi:hypothetical protein
MAFVQTPMTNNALSETVVGKRKLLVIDWKTCPVDRQMMFRLYGDNYPLLFRRERKQSPTPE